MLSIKEKKVIFGFSDFLILICSTLVAYVGVALISPSTKEDLMSQLNWVAFSGGVLFVTASLNDCLDVTSINSRNRYLRRWGVAWLITFGLYLLLFFFMGRPAGSVWNGHEVPRLIPAVFCLVALFSVPAGRLVIERFLGISALKKACVVVGAGGSGRHFIENVASINGEWNVISILDDDPEKVGQSICGIPISGRCSELLSLIQTYDVQEVILAISHEVRGEVIDALMVCFERGIDVVPVQIATERTLMRISIKHLGDKWLPTTFWASSTMPLFYRVIKRTLDLSISILLLIISFPVILVAAVAVKTTSKGSIFYCQKRVGLHGHAFKIVKIRTMIQNAEIGGAQWAALNDNRITSVGRFLRATRIDELPQLWNIIKGDMSLVGPRPERPEFTDELELKIPFYRARFSVRPGVTGWAQIKYKYTNTLDDTNTKLEYDLYYIKNRSIYLDLFIIGKTIKTVIQCKGA